MGRRILEIIRERAPVGTRTLMTLLNIPNEITLGRRLQDLRSALAILGGPRVIVSRRGQGYYFSPPVDAEAAFQQLRSSGRFGAGQGGEGSEDTVVEAPVTDDSPTVMLPADMVLDSRIHDDSAESEQASRAT